MWTDSFAGAQRGQPLMHNWQTHERRNGSNIGIPAGGL